jgi:rhodanese-related sulfurtransferase
MAQLQASMPGARRALFMKYHIGGCQSCGFADDETLAEVCQRNENLPIDEVINHLEESAAHDLAIQVTPEELKQKLKTSAVPRLLDIRSREEFEAVRIDQSELLTPELQQEAFGSWQREQQVVIIDHVGDRALDVAAFFIGHGLSQTHALMGGIDAYARDADTSLPRYEIELTKD